MEPQAPLRGDVGDPAEVVDEPAVRGAAGGDDGEDVVRVLGVVERSVERFTGETSLLVGRDDDHPRVHHAGGCCDGRMRGIAHGHR